MIRKLPFLVTIAMLVTALVLLVACDTGAPAIQPTPLPTITVAPQQPRPSPPAADTRILYQYKGGIAGYNKELVIGPNGKARLTDRNVSIDRVQLSPDRISQLMKRFDDVHFFDLQDKYQKSDLVVADDIYITISLTQGERTKTVTMAQVAGQDVTPQPLKDLAAELDKIAAEVQAGAGATPTPLQN